MHRKNHILIKLQKSASVGPVTLDLDWRDFEGMAVQISENTQVTLELGGETRVADSYEIANQKYAGLSWQSLDMDTAIEEAQRLAPV